MGLFRGCDRVPGRGVFHAPIFGCFSCTVFRGCTAGSFWQHAVWGSPPCWRLQRVSGCTAHWLARPSSGSLQLAPMLELAWVRRPKAEPAWLDSDGRAVSSSEPESGRLRTVGLGRAERGGREAGSTWAKGRSKRAHPQNALYKSFKEPLRFFENFRDPT